MQEGDNGWQMVGRAYDDNVMQSKTLGGQPSVLIYCFFACRFEPQ